MNNMMKACALAAAFLSFGATVSASAEPIEEKNLLKGKDEIKADSGYIFMQGEGRFAGVLLKIPSQEDVAEYEADWEKKLAKARKKYERAEKNYEADYKLARAEGRTPPERMSEPTPENFAIDPIEFRNSQSFGPQYVFAKPDTSNGNMYSYLQQVEPGTYVYYGPVNVTGNAAFGACYCMGSIQFEVKPGVITNVGDMLQKGGSIADAALVDHDDAVIPQDPDPVSITSVNFGLPESLQKYDSVKADFRASKKYANRFGIMISRIRPIEGVLAYDRDMPVDLKSASMAGQGAKAPPVSSNVEQGAKLAEDEVVDTESLEQETADDQI